MWKKERGGKAEIETISSQICELNSMEGGKDVYEKEANECRLRKIIYIHI